jgi:hypothetical protein
MSGANMVTSRWVHVAVTIKVPSMLCDCNWLLT